MHVFNFKPKPGFTIDVVKAQCIKVNAVFLASSEASEKSFLPFLYHVEDSHHFKSRCFFLSHCSSQSSNILPWHYRSNVYQRKGKVSTVSWHCQSLMSMLEICLQHWKSLKEKKMPLIWLLRSFKSKANAVSKAHGKLDNVIAVSLALLEASC